MNFLDHSGRPYLSGITPVSHSPTYTHTPKQTHTLSLCLSLPLLLPDDRGSVICVYVKSEGGEAKS